jgi:hypothetical protein
MKTNNIKKEKDFDCIKMKNDIQTKLYEKIKNLTFQGTKRIYLKSVEFKYGKNIKPLPTEIVFQNSKRTFFLKKRKKYLYSNHVCIFVWKQSEMNG